MVVAEPEPRPVVQARAVDEEQELAAGPRKARAERPPVQLQRTAALAQLHLDREGVSGLAQAVAEHAVEDGEHGLAPGPGRIVRDERGELRQGAIHAGAHPPGTPRMLP